MAHITNNCIVHVIFSINFIHHIFTLSSRYLYSIYLPSSLASSFIFMHLSISNVLYLSTVMDLQEPSAVVRPISCRLVYIPDRAQEFVNPFRNRSNLGHLCIEEGNIQIPFHSKIFLYFQFCWESSEGVFLVKQWGTYLGIWVILWPLIEQGLHPAQKYSF